MEPRAFQDEKAKEPEARRLPALMERILLAQASGGFIDGSDGINNRAVPRELIEVLFNLVDCIPHSVEGPSLAVPELLVIMVIICIEIGVLDRVHERICFCDVKDCLVKISVHF